MLYWNMFFEIFWKPFKNENIIYILLLNINVSKYVALIKKEILLFFTNGTMRCLRTVTLAIFVDMLFH